MERPLYFGFDPGMDGALACIHGRWADAVNMPTLEVDGDTFTDPAGLQSFIALAVEFTGATVGFAAVERQVLRPHDPASVGPLMISFGECRAISSMAGIWFDEFGWDQFWPVHWQKAFGLWGRKWAGKTRGQKTADKKRTHRDLAHRLFPKIGGQMSDGMADALLIAAYGAAQFGNRPLDSVCR